MNENQFNTYRCSISPELRTFSTLHINIWRQYRENKVGGGVSIFIHHDYEYRTRHDLCLNSEMVPGESIFTEMFVEAKKLKIFGCIYRPPNTVISEFNDYMANAMDVLNKEGKLLFILDDFNKSLQDGNSEMEDFLSTIYSNYSYHLLWWVYLYLYKKATLIDNIFISPLN